MSECYVLKNNEDYAYFKMETYFSGAITMVGGIVTNIVAITAIPQKGIWGPFDQITEDEMEQEWGGGGEIHKL